MVTRSPIWSSEQTGIYAGHSVRRASRPQRDLVFQPSRINSHFSVCDPVHFLFIIFHATGLCGKSLSLLSKSWQKVSSGLPSSSNTKWMQSGTHTSTSPVNGWLARFLLVPSQQRTKVIIGQMNEAYLSKKFIKHTVHFTAWCWSLYFPPWKHFTFYSIFGSQQLVSLKETRAGSARLNQKGRDA